MPQSHAQIWIHIVFSTKERRPFLLDSTGREGCHTTLRTADALARQSVAT
ncbi:MAG: hypothetical protein KDB27_09410 [Planctomycetales bacterium]|nr:hypothetical protein [Planctomycetales bacterium]